ncbi:unnamed protein product [Adineta ricciae]|uniref:RING-type domain-containing protein n=1 Tax=Adineta ricciae TaxID=249248 RepID=A0A814F8S0_ADIRI|nr:unnamed protein product [Adineta ricciae]CAF1415997.1 unnamed protein product [Adineta ricciae]
MNTSNVTDMSNASNSEPDPFTFMGYYCLSMVVLGTIFNLFTLTVLCRTTFRNSQVRPMIHYMRAIAAIDFLGLYGWTLDAYFDAVYGFTLNYSYTVASSTPDDCSICLCALIPGAPLLTLPCSHKFHLECFALNLQADNHQCPLCRTTVDSNSRKSKLTLRSFFIGINPNRSRLLPSTGRNDRFVRDSTNANPVHERTSQIASNELPGAQLTNALSDMPFITVPLTLEFGGQLSTEESTIHRLVTFEAPSGSELSRRFHTPIDLICVVDQSSSMSAEEE